jgi:hypothetical protein
MQLGYLPHHQCRELWFSLCVLDGDCFSKINRMDNFFNGKEVKWENDVVKWKQTVQI